MQDLTTGSITRHLLKTASYMLITMVFQTLYFLVDLYWVGRLGKEAVAAVGIAGNLTFIVLAVSQMLGVGTTTLVSHATGRKDHERALLVFNQSQVLSMVVGGIFLAVALLLRDSYSATLGADPQTALQAKQYLTWFIPAMALQFAMVAMGAALRGTGNFKPGTIVATATVILNMVLAPFLIFGWGTGVPLGVAGAAISSLVAVAVGVIWLGTYFIRTTLVSALRPVAMEAADLAVESDAQDWASRWRGVRPHRGVSVCGLFDQPAVRGCGASRFRHRSAGGTGRVHARRRARIFGRSGCRSELRRAAV